MPYVIGRRCIERLERCNDKVKGEFLGPEFRSKG